MCLPVAALAIAGAALGGIGTMVSAIQSSAASNYKAQIEDRNAQIEHEAANQEQENTRLAALDHYRKVAQLKGQQIVGAAANGVSTDFGTAADNVSDTEMLAAEDVNRLYKQGAQNVRAHDIGAWNNVAQANADRAAASGALISGAFGAASTVLSGASQYQRLKAGMPGSTATSPKAMGGYIVNMGSNRGFGV